MENIKEENILGETQQFIFGVLEWRRKAGKTIIDFSTFSLHLEENGDYLTEN